MCEKRLICVIANEIFQICLIAKEKSEILKQPNEGEFRKLFKSFLFFILFFPFSDREHFRKYSKKATQFISTKFG